MKDELPKQQFSIAIQALVGSKVFGKFSTFHVLGASSLVRNRIHHGVHCTVYSVHY